MMIAISSCFWISLRITSYTRRNVKNQSYTLRNDNLSVTLHAYADSNCSHCEFKLNKPVLHFDKEKDMITLVGYTIVGKIYESERTIIYRAHRNKDDTSVIIKTHATEYPSHDEIVSFRREYEIGHKVKASGIIQYYGTEKYRHNELLIIEDFGGDSLDKLILNNDTYICKATNIPVFLNIAIQLVDAIAEIHKQGIIHKDIKPSNIVVLLNIDRPTEPPQIKVIDFGIASKLKRETQQMLNPNQLQGTLAYISPEQTGRMNRVIDYRTDFYSLGMTFYEMLVGHLPFDTTDAMELVHSHIARIFSPPHQVNHRIPKQLSAIIMKLLAKNAEDRYQSDFGLRVDLERCLQAYQKTGDIPVFDLAEQDLSDRFEIPQKLYGRDTEIARLLDAFERVAGEKYLATLQGPELVLLAGYLGAGKSALVSELYKPITEKRGHFVPGKYGRYQRNIPYFGLTQALNELCNQLLTESRALLAMWKEKILAAVGKNGQVLIEVVPNLELIIGKQSPVSRLEPQERQNRFNMVLLNFLRAMSQADHPLVIFLDDLQWADPASLQILYHIMTAEQLHYLLILGSYRANEVDNTHPLMKTVAEISASNADIVPDNSNITFVKIGNLAKTDINQLIADTLHCELTYAQPLTDLVYEKTQGNAYFTTEFLKSLYEESLLIFDYYSPAQGQLKGGWRWDVEQIQAKNITDNVINLLTNKISQLAPETQSILKWAACFGIRFELTVLTMLYTHRQTIATADTSEVLSLLWPAIHEGLIVPLPQETYKFQHDRVRHAAYTLGDDETKQAIHLEIGRLLLANTPVNQFEERLFDIVNQCDQGRALITEEQELVNLAALNLRAGRKAKAAAAYKPALAYLQTGVDLLATLPNTWTRYYDLNLNLHRRGSEAAYLSAEFDQMNRLIEAVLTYAQTPLDKIPVYEIKVAAYDSQNQIIEAVQIGLEALQLLEISFPTQPTEADIAIQINGTAKNIQAVGLDNLLKQQPMVNPNYLAAMRLLSMMWTATYHANSTQFLLNVLTQVNLAISYGYTPDAMVAYATYASILCAHGEIEFGYQLGQVVLKLLEQTDRQERKAEAYAILYDLVLPWKEHLRATTKSCLSAYHVGLEVGDIEWAANIATIYCSHRYYAGVALDELAKELASYSQAIEQLQQHVALNMNRIYWQATLNLMGQVDEPWRLAGEACDETHLIRQEEQAHDYITLCRYYVEKIVLCYLFHQYHEAIAVAEQVETHLTQVTGELFVPRFYFYDALVRLALYPEMSQAKQAETVERVQRYQHQMKSWADHAPMNYHHRWHLVEAELARVLGEQSVAREHYDQAIALAETYNYLQEEALAYELTGKFYIARNQFKFAQLCLREAHYDYDCWGAVAKVKDLENHYAELLALDELHHNRQMTDILTVSVGSTTITSLDVSTVIKSFQAISSEIDLDKLLVKLIEILIENAGAQRGCLLLAQDDQLFIDVEYTVEEGQPCILPSIPLVIGQPNEWLMPEVCYYASRTQETVVLANASQVGKFTRTEYVIKNQPLSILCTPLLNHGTLMGLIYLENNLTTNCFSPERVEIVTMLGTQATISIANAKAITVKAEQHRLQLENDFLEKQSQELAKLNADKDKFFSIVAHDLRGPFTPLLGNAELLFKMADQIPPEMVSDMSRDIYISAQRILGLLEELLQWARLQMGRMEFQPGRVNLYAMVQQTIELLSSSATKKQITLKNKVPTEMFVLADERMLDTIIRNLSNNALKFTPPEGQITVGALKIFLNDLNSSSIADESLNINLKDDEEKPSIFAEIFVADTGVGIAEENLAKLFRLDIHHTTEGTANEQGTGLGLIMCKEMVEQHQGHIWVESELGEGTTFKFTIPLDDTIETTLATVESTSLTDDDMVSPQSLDLDNLPSIRQLEFLYDLAMSGDIQAIQEQLTGIKIMNDAYIPFVNQIHVLAKHFEDEAIAELLSHYITEKQDESDI